MIEIRAAGGTLSIDQVRPGKIKAGGRCGGHDYDEHNAQELHAFHSSPLMIS
jgi:hypothetical protein